MGEGLDEQLKSMQKQLDALEDGFKRLQALIYGPPSLKLDLHQLKDRVDSLEVKVANTATCQ